MANPKFWFDIFGGRAAKKGMEEGVVVLQPLFDIFLSMLLNFKLIFLSHFVVLQILLFDE